VRKATILFRILEVLRPQADLPLEGRGLGLREGESLSGRVVAILFE